VIQVTDDGRGLDLKAIRRKAIQQQLMSAEAQLTDREVMQFILESGFSTAKEISQISGRGVGLDVVGSEVKQTGGSLYIDSRAGKWTAFTIRLPLTLTVSQALLVEVAEELYAIPLLTIEGVIKLDKRELEDLYLSPAPELSRGRRTYQFLPMAALLDVPEEARAAVENQPLLLFSVGDMNMALAVDGLLGAREIVVKSLGAQLGRVREISGATILGDGRVVLILDMGSLLRKSLALHGVRAPMVPEVAEEAPKRVMPRVLVVDDSITVRKVTAHVLKRHHLEVVASKDGVDAVAFLEQDEAPPDVILMDIEMPRMDGFELAGYVRNNPRLKGIPIIMITSRTGTKHRERAAALGVNRYLGKPYQESELLDAIRDLIPVD
jgi:chemosensory pili system protein ChpA (sensor histidine kinase/response regulator)